MKNNILTPAVFPCSGCGACCSVCARDAIHLKLDDAGFFTAVVEEENCINCGLCKAVCTRYDDQIRGVSLTDLPVYALQSSREETVRKCSSGGIAHELAAQTLRDGGKVIGAVYNTGTDQAEHRIAEEETGIAAFAGSKYLQSNPEEAFRTALNHARQDPSARYTVFGTPCQIAGFAKSSALLGLRDRFLLVEIFCHGVPSYKVWEEQCAAVRKKLNARRFDAVQFRYKKNDWHSYCLKIDAGEQTCYGARETALFWQVFFENVLLGDSCYTCRLRKEISLADIRLGDYWGARFQNRSDGVSAAFACTGRGVDALEKLLQQGSVVSLESGDAAEMLKAQNMAGYRQQALHDRAMAELRRNGAGKAVALYRRELPGKQKLKRVLLIASALLPDDLRAKLRKRNSSRSLNKRN